MRNGRTTAAHTKPPSSYQRYATDFKQRGPDGQRLAAQISASRMSRNGLSKVGRSERSRFRCPRIKRLPPKGLCAPAPPPPQPPQPPPSQQPTVDRAGRLEPAVQLSGVEKNEGTRNWPKAQDPAGPVSSLLAASSESSVSEIRRFREICSGHQAVHLAV